MVEEAARNGEAAKAAAEVKVAEEVAAVEAEKKEAITLDKNILATSLVILCIPLMFLEADVEWLDHLA